MNEILNQPVRAARSPYLRMAPANAQGPHEGAAEPTDRFAGAADPAPVAAPPVLAEHPAQEAEVPARRSFLAAGALALAMAAPLLSGCVATAMMPAPLSLSLSQTSIVEDTAPITASQRAAMERAGAERAEDSDTARDVRETYRNHALDIQKEAGSFHEIASRIGAQVRQLDEATRDVSRGGTIESDGFTITVDENGSRIQAVSRGVTIESVREGDARTVTVRSGRTEERLEENPYTKTVVSGRTRRTLHKVDREQYGFQAGDFQVSRQETPVREVRVFVRDANIQQETRETIHGFAGDIRQERREKWEIPQFSILPEVRLDMRYTSAADSLDTVTGQASHRTREVLVYNDGSTAERVTDTEGEITLLTTQGAGEVAR